MHVQRVHLPMWLPAQQWYPFPLFLKNRAFSCYLTPFMVLGLKVPILVTFLEVRDRCRHQGNRPIRLDDVNGADDRTPKIV